MLAALYAKLKSARFYVNAGCGQSAKFNSRQYFLLYGTSSAAINTRGYMCINLCMYTIMCNSASSPLSLKVYRGKLV